MTSASVGGGGAGWEAILCSHVDVCCLRGWHGCECVFACVCVRVCGEGHSVNAGLSTGLPARFLGECCNFFPPKTRPNGEELWRSSADGRCETHGRVAVEVLPGSRCAQRLAASF